MQDSLTLARARLRAAVDAPDPTAKLADWIGAREAAGAPAAETYALMEAEEDRREARGEPEGSRARRALAAAAEGYFETRDFADAAVEAVLGRLDVAPVVAAAAGTVVDPQGRPVDLTGPRAELELETCFERLLDPPLALAVLASVLLVGLAAGAGLPLPGLGDGAGGVDPVLVLALVALPVLASRLVRSLFDEVVALDFQSRTLGISSSFLGLGWVEPLARFEEIAALTVDAGRGGGACAYWVVAVLGDGDKVALSDPAASLAPVDAYGALLAGRMGIRFVPGEAWSRLVVAGGGRSPLSLTHACLPRERARDHRHLVPA